jgi:thymidylate kinase
VLVVDPGTALGRQKRPDRIGAESVEFQEDVYNAYAELAREEPQRVLLLRGDENIDALVDRIIAVIGGD